ncbi:GAF domain-containing protein [Planobispora takensis]|uniref:OmpR/PhoB-type domain-containing protein n=1 Tax=Planobispora takensis TaxID=1367882 RepID=A0A8J3WRH1_9ACTN|nr:helix-turn-helix domain-containing protein [Planobispora takensis]GIH98117.1 hypothetical protein Pta02_01260 [Planobispora takensis]
MTSGHPRSVPAHRQDAHPTRLRRLYEAALTGGGGDEAPRGVISDSWRRSLDAGVDPGITAAPLALDKDDVPEVWSAHPMSRLLPLLTESLLRTADETAHVLVVTDAEGRVLWRDGNHRVLNRADEVCLADGFHWGEGVVGTNGIGTALATGRPVHVRSAEHLLSVLHPWSCSSAPITDPDSGRVIGCVDISGITRALHPATVALVEIAARLAESHLALFMRERDDRFRTRYEGRLRALRGEPGALVTTTGRIVAGEPAGTWERIDLPHSGNTVVLPDGRTGVLEPLKGGFLLRLPNRTHTPVLALSFLGAEHPVARIDGATVPLSLRHAEILALLALHPRGLTADQLSFHLYGDEGNPVTIRAEIHRLRAQLGPVISAKPYRLACTVEADFVTVRRSLTGGAATPFTGAYGGPLLPRSESPAIRREREELEGQMRARVLRRGTPEDLWAYAETESGRDDIQVLERLTTALPPDDPRAATARIRLSTLD